MVSRAEMAGRRSGGEKPSSFSVTCSLLSQYLKEKGSLGDLSLGITAARPPPVEGRGKPETLRTRNLLPGMEVSEMDDDADRKKSPAMSMELFPQRAGFAPVHSDKKPDLNREPRAAAAQMTIFYGGKVVVFDNFPVDKAKELMAMAGRGCPDPAQVFRVEQPGARPAVLPQRAPSCPPPAQHSSVAATIIASTSESKPAAAAAAVASTPAVVVQEAQQKPTQPASSDLPIARRVSLHRFLEKRKDRITSKAPYQLNGPAGASASSSASPAKPEEARHWLGLAPQASEPEDLP